MKVLKNFIKSSKRIVVSIIPDKIWIQYIFKRANGKKLNLTNPQTFCEKIQWLKLHDRKPEYSLMVDKYLVKKYVASIIGEEYIIPTLGVWDSPDDIDFSQLPNQFVLKTTHNSGGVLICKNKSNFNIDSAISYLKKQLKHDIYSCTREWPYKNVPKRIIAEKFIIPSSSDLTDYKFFCFGGEPIYCQVIANRSINETIDFYDTQWNHQPFNGLNTVGMSNTPHNKPKAFDKMLTIARLLSKGHAFLRVDLYNINGRIFFGEITFFPNSGLGKFSPSEWNIKLGNLIDLSNLK